VVDQRKPTVSDTRRKSTNPKERNRESVVKSRSNTTKGQGKQRLRLKLARALSTARRLRGRKKGRWRKGSPRPSAAGSTRGFQGTTGQEGRGKPTLFRRKESQKGNQEEAQRVSAPDARIGWSRSRPDSAGRKKSRPEAWEQYGSTKGRTKLLHPVLRREEKGKRGQ